MPKAPEDRQRANNLIIVVDFGAQYAQLIARRIREARVYSEIVPHTVRAADVASRSPLGIILSGGPSSVYADWAPGVDSAIYDLDIPILGICYGAQLMARDLGGRVERTARGEYGRTWLKIAGPRGVSGAAGSPGVPGSPSREILAAPLREIGLLLQASEDAGSPQVWMSHADAIVEPPEGAVTIASTVGAPVAAFEDVRRRFYGVQFHPEVSHTVGGQELLERFIFDVCGASPTWTHISIIENSVDDIRRQVGQEKVLCALSGGVDSAVAAAMSRKAVGGHLVCAFIDTGLLRKDEADQVEEVFGNRLGMDLVRYDATDAFFRALAGVTDPEEKRKAIGEVFIRAFEEVARSVHHPRFLVQGTLYPDVIESGGGGSGQVSLIKSHHNVGGLPDDLSFELVEPLRMLFKDEVRAVGEELGLPEDILWRQPFPGPGLAVRVVGEVTRERVEILRAADAVLEQEIRKAGLYRELWQSFAVLPAIRTVGVMGDQRTYAYPIVIRAVTSEDAMTADWARLPYDLVEKIAARLIGEVEGVNRVVLDVTSKPPGTIEWE
ncbi:MAG: glutamine-hydrolyzing GMP synthase [Actinobacteria bacterium]|nr:glutamine-hydrolyzing GMP synthase [Actinomycetota bacterium]MCL5446558.1 glutamine-hydrolyzing GMP synthase [Actinomycetota bacterium]